MAKFVQIGNKAYNLSQVKIIKFNYPGRVQIGPDALPSLRGEEADAFREWWGSEAFHRWWESDSPLYVLES